MTTSTPELLPEIDRDYLDDKGYVYSVIGESGVTNVIIDGYSLPEAYTPTECRMLLRLPAGYPNAMPDMFWTQPTIRLANGSMPHRADVPENYIGQSWQRWSRHFEGWRPGVDSLRTYMATIRRELAKGI